MPSLIRRPPQHLQVARMPTTHFPLIEVLISEPTPVKYTDKTFLGGLVLSFSRHARHEDATGLRLDNHQLRKRPLKLPLCPALSSIGSVSQQQRQIKKNVVFTTIVMRNGSELLPSLFPRKESPRSSRAKAILGYLVRIHGHNCAVFFVSRRCDFLSQFSRERCLTPASLTLCPFLVPPPNQDRRFILQAGSWVLVVQQRLRHAGLDQILR